jgi:hypothetical protein
MKAIASSLTAGGKRKKKSGVKPPHSKARPRIFGLLRLDEAFFLCFENLRALQ